MYIIVYQVVYLFYEMFVYTLGLISIKNIVLIKLQEMIDIFINKQCNNYLCVS